MKRIATEETFLGMLVKTEVEASLSATNEVLDGM